MERVEDLTGADPSPKTFVERCASFTRARKDDAAAPKGSHWECAACGETNTNVNKNAAAGSAPSTGAAGDASPPGSRISFLISIRIFAL